MYLQNELSLYIYIYIYIYSVLRYNKNLIETITVYVENIHLSLTAHWWLCLIEPSNEQASARVFIYVRTPPYCVSDKSLWNKLPNNYLFDGMLSLNNSTASSTEYRVLMIPFNKNVQLIWSAGHWLGHTWNTRHIKAMAVHWVPPLKQKSAWWKLHSQCFNKTSHDKYLSLKVNKTTDK